MNDVTSASTLGITMRRPRSQRLVFVYLNARTYASMISA